MNKITMFDKIMTLMSEKVIVEKIADNKSDKWYKTFTTKDHLAVMVFAQLMNCKSIRELAIQFNTMQNKNYTEVKRSTFSDANTFRSSAFFEALCKTLVDKQQNDVNDALRLFDSTPIIISGRGSEWVLARSTRHIKGLKVHIQLAPQQLRINQMIITPPNVNDITVAKSWEPTAGTINIFDKGYFDFNWWHKIHLSGAYFVTRTKKNTKYKVIQENTRTKDTSDGILSDQLILLQNKNPRGGKINLLADIPLRLVTYFDSIHRKTYTFITNLLTVPPEEIAAYYKMRWEIEIFFKWLKQNLKIKRFLGTNENAIKIQIYTAIITYILLRELAKTFKLEFIRMKDLLAWIKMVVYRPIEDLLFLSRNICKMSYFCKKKCVELCV